MTDTAKPNRPFHLWLEDVFDLDHHNDLGGIRGIQFYWDCYRRNYSPVGCLDYNMSGAIKIKIPEGKQYKDSQFRAKPFPGEPYPDIMMDLGLV